MSGACIVKSSGIAGGGLAWLYADRGAFDEARAVATQLSEYGHAHPNALAQGRGRWVLPEVLHRMGDLDGAEREIQVTLARAGEEPDAGEGRTP